MSDTIRRRGWLVSAVSLALWALSTLSLAGYVFVVGLSSEQRQAAQAFAQRPLEASPEPLVVLMASTVVLCVLAVLSLLYYSYAQWRSATRRLERLESGGASGSDGSGDAD